MINIYIFVILNIPICRGFALLRHKTKLQLYSLVNVIMMSLYLMNSKKTYFRFLKYLSKILVTSA